MLAALWVRFQGWMLTAGAVLLVLVGAYAAGGRAARRSVQLDNASRNAAAKEKAREADHKHNSMATDDLRDRARERVRNRSKR